MWVATHGLGVSDITEVVDVGEVREATFFGKPIGEMDREELLATVNWLMNEREKEQERRFEAEKSKAELMGEFASR